MPVVPINEATEDEKGRQIRPILYNTAKDGSGTWYVPVVDSNGMTVILPYTMAVAQGGISGHTTINKFGRNIEIDSNATADIWDGGATVGALPAGTSLIWVSPTAAATHDITSTSTSDDGDPVGVGARTLKIFGLPDWDNKEISEVITMNGTGNVETTNSYVIIYRMQVLTKGATNVNVGTITATAKAPSATTITARIEVGKGQTQMAIFAIPSTQTFYIDRFYANMNKAGGASGQIDVALLVNPEPDAELTNFLVKHTFGLEKVGTTAFLIPFTTPKTIDGPAIIKVQVESATNDMDVSAGFDGMIVNN